MFILSIREIEELGYKWQSVTILKIKGFKVLCNKHGYAFILFGFILRFPVSGSSGVFLLPS